MSAPKIKQERLELGSITSNSNNVFLTQREYDALDVVVQNNGTYYYIVSEDGTVLLLNTSGSTYPVETTSALTKTYNTENLDINDSENGNLYILPDTSSFSKTVIKQGEGTTNIFSKVRTGYVSMSGTDIITIGNNNITIPKSGLIGILCRFDPSQLNSLSGNVNLLKTNQIDQNGITKFSMGFGGNSSPDTVKRNRGFIQKAGLTNSVAAEQVEILNTNFGWDNNGNINILDTSLGKWVWLWGVMKDSTDRVTNYRTMNYNGGSTNFQPNNSISPLAAIHGDNTTIGNTYWRRSSNRALYGLTSGTGIVSETTNNTSLEISVGGINVDIARVILALDFQNVKNAVFMSNGAHPLQLGLNIDDGFCLDFGSLPSIATQTNGASVFNSNSIDSPEAYVFNGTNENNNTISYNNKAIV